MAERSAQGVLSRAQQFEDEKKRIMQSCFAKQDTDGSCGCSSQPACNLPNTHAEFRGRFIL